LFFNFLKNNADVADRYVFGQNMDGGTDSDNETMLGITCDNF
jgi:hypothetical protein